MATYLKRKQTLLDWIKLESTIVIVGAGPRGTGILERLVCNVAKLPSGHVLNIHVIDPYIPGAGKVWRPDQTPLMWLNIPAANVTMFTDETVECAGPASPGPSLDRWMTSCGRFFGVGDSSFPSRVEMGLYLSWVFWRTVAQRPDNVSIFIHRTRVVRLEGKSHEPQRVWLGGEESPIVAEAVVLALGHLDGELSATEKEMTQFADKHGLLYFPRGHAAEWNLSAVQPGRRVLMRGLGLTFVDHVILLTEGRGGRFSWKNGLMRYIPSGREPIIYAGSRRGVPNRTKISYGQLQPIEERSNCLREQCRSINPTERLDFRSDVWPIIEKDINWAYYQELFRSHPASVVADWSSFAARFEELNWNSCELKKYIQDSVPDTENRLNLDYLNNPLCMINFSSIGQFQSYVQQHISADIERSLDRRFSADLAAINALGTAQRVVRTLCAKGVLLARSMEFDTLDWWQGFHDHLRSGPPNLRARQLLALSECGILNFLGADMRVHADATSHVFRAGSATVPDTISASVLIEARTPKPSVVGTHDPLMNHLIQSGDGCEYTLGDDDGFIYRSFLLHVSTEDFRVLDRLGGPHYRRFAIGPFTSIPEFSTFTRPNANGLSFRQNDSLAQLVLQTISK